MITKQYLEKYLTEYCLPYNPSSNSSTNITLPSKYEIDQAHIMVNLAGIDLYLIQLLGVPIGYFKLWFIFQIIFSPSVISSCKWAGAGLLWSIAFL